MSRRLQGDGCNDLSVTGVDLTKAGSTNGDDTMKMLLTTVALAATVVAIPAAAEVGCKWGNPLNGSMKLTDCTRNSTSFRTTRISPHWMASDAYAYVPQRRVVIRRGWLQDDLDSETRLKGGSD
jgi:hypothetical protein